MNNGINRNTAQLLGLERGVLGFSIYRDEWKDLYQSERKLILSVIGNDIIDIQHVGSTAVPVMIAKPILDIGIAVDDFEKARVFEKKEKKKYLVVFTDL